MSKPGTINVVSRRNVQGGVRLTYERVRRLRLPGLRRVVERERFAVMYPVDKWDWE